MGLFLGSTSSISYRQAALVAALSSLSMLQSCGKQQANNTPNTAESVQANSGVASSTLNTTTSLSTVDLNSATLQFLGNDYSQYRVDHMLRLQIAHQYRIQIAPKLTQKNGNQFSVQSPALAKMKVSIALFGGQNSDPWSTSNLISSSQQLVTVKNGIATFDVSFKYSQLALATMRNTFLIEVSSADGQSSFESKCFSGKMPSVREGSEIKLVETTENLEQLLTQATNKQNEEQQTAYGLFLKSTTVKKIPLSIFPKSYVGAPARGQSSEATIGQAQLEQFVSDLKSHRAQAQRAFCELAYGIPHVPKTYRRGETPSREDLQVHAPDRSTLFDTDLSYCNKNPEASLSFSVMDFVEKIENAVPTKIGPSESMAMSVSASITDSADFSKSVSKGNTKSAGVNLNGSLGVGTPKSFPLNGSLGLGVSFGGSVFRTYSETDSTSHSTNTSLSTRRSFLADIATFEIAALVKSCLIVEAKQNRYFVPKMLCLAPKSMKKRELFTFISQSSDNGKSPYYDSDAAGSAIKFVVRGHKRFQEFSALMTNSKTRLVVAGEVTPQMLNNSKSANYGLDFAFPGAFDRR